jgi:hypothetical protein
MYYIRINFLIVMSVQITDTIVLNGNIYSIYIRLMEQYWNGFIRKPKVFSFSTDMERGYFAELLMIEKELYLTSF